MKLLTDKELLYLDLCARLPYNVVLRCTDENDPSVGFNCFLTEDILNDIRKENPRWTYKPYLKPLRSMTFIERNELCKEFYVENEYGIRVESPDPEECYIAVDWMNEGKYDYRHLIEKDLAIEVTEQNNPY